MADSTAAVSGDPMLRVVWWNARLGKRAVKTEKERADRRLAAVPVLSSLLARSVDVLAIGEIEDSDVKWLTNESACKSALRPYQANLHGQGVGIHAFALRKRVLMKDVCQHDKSSQYGRPVRAAISARVCMKNFDAQLHLYLVHWASHLREDQKADRDCAARAVYNSVSRLKGAFKEPVLIMGDFNDEPFSESLTTHLQASRDRDRVRSETSLFYNPFWRKLGESSVLQEEHKGRRAAGTCFYEKGRDSRWRTYDQAIVSSSMLRHEGWTLREDLTGILQTAPLVTSSVKLDPFDHLPIEVVLSYTQQTESKQ